MKLSEVYSVYVKELELAVERARSRIAEATKGRKYVYVCEDGRVYMGRPKKCHARRVPIDEYIEEAVEQSVKKIRAVVEGWKWLAENCNDVLDLEVFYSTSGIAYFKDGYMHVLGSEEPEIVVVMRDMEAVHTYRSFIECLARCPYRAVVFIGSRSRGLEPKEVLEKLVRT